MQKVEMAKRGVPAVVTLALCLLTFHLARAAEPADSVVAVVGDGLILSSELAQAVDFATFPRIAETREYKLGFDLE